jgi:hypothetical protein
MVIAFTAASFCLPVEASISYISPGSSYTQSFNSLAAVTATNIPWADDTTLPGWFSNRTSYNAGTGSSATGALYSFGVVSLNFPPGDRALGSVASGTTGTIQYGLLLTNNTGGVLDSFTVTYDGEQWRDGNPSPTALHRLTFDYLIGSGLTLATAGYTSVPALDFEGPVSSGAAGALDGNNPPNNVTGISDTISGISWAAGQELFLRWTDLDSASNDHGLAIDNFSFSARAPDSNGVVPESASIVIHSIIFGMAGLLYGWRFRSQFRIAG